MMPEEITRDGNEDILQDDDFVESETEFDEGDDVDDD